MKIGYNPNRAANLAAAGRMFGDSIAFTAPPGEFIHGGPIPAGTPAVLLQVGLNPLRVDGVSPDQPSAELEALKAINSARDAAVRSADREFLDQR